VSDLHVLITSQSTGGGGRLYTMAFLGRNEFEGASVGLYGVMSFAVARRTQEMPRSSAQPAAARGRR
jgi:hypothetical protein